MSKNPFMPRTDAGKSNFQHNFGDKLAGAAGYKTKYGISTGQVTDIQDGDAYFKYWLDVLEEVDTFKRKVTAFKNELRDGVPPGAVASLPPAVPVFAAAPTAVDPGIFARSGALGSSIKSHKDYVVSDGQDMGLEGTQKAAPDVVHAKPVLKIVLIAGKPEIQWAKGLFDAIWIEVDRDGTGYKFLTIDTEPDYSDTAALPASAALWKYRAIYIFHDEKVGEMSDEVSVSVKA
jgi:hypothetical protein